MEEYPRDDYVVSIDSIRQVINYRSNLLLDKLLDEGNSKKIADFVNEKLHTRYPTCMVYKTTEQDAIKKKLKPNTWYIVFEGVDIFTKLWKKATENFMFNG